MTRLDKPSISPRPIVGKKGRKKAGNRYVDWRTFAEEEEEKIPEREIIMNDLRPIDDVLNMLEQNENDSRYYDKNDDMTGSHSTFINQNVQASVIK